MLKRGSMLKIPKANASLGKYNDPACGYYDGQPNFGSCQPYQGTNCIDVNYSKPCDWGFSTVIGGGGIVISVVLAT